jgi:hypothetical protein
MPIGLLQSGFNGPLPISTIDAGTPKITTEQLLLRLPEALVRRFRRTIPEQDRNAFVQRLLEQALPAEDANDAPYGAALAVERDAALDTEMAGWEAATLGDGLGQEEGLPVRP